MSNEKYIEELYYNAHKSGVFNEFSSEIDKKMSSERGIGRYEVTEKVYFQFLSEGLIKE